MNEVLCKKDTCHYDEVFLYKDQLYESKGLKIFINDGSSTVVEMSYLNIEDFNWDFYTVEETKAILRQRKIKLILENE